MAVFSINQVNHLYYAKTLKSGTNLSETDEAGSILPKGDTNKTHMYFQYMSPGGIVRSDLIGVNRILSAKAATSASLAYKLKRYLITLDSDVSATPVAGQEYILRIIFRQYIGLGDEDQNQKYGCVKAKTGMTASDFYKEMAISLLRNVVAEKYNTLLNIYLKDASSETPLTKSTDLSSLSDTYTGIILEEAEQPWVLGLMPQAIIPFDPLPTTIMVDGDHFIWGKVEAAEAKNTIGDGHKIADLEYFCMGARGDDYRLMGYPNYIPTKYLVDPEKKYDVLNIHYCFTDSNEGVQQSEKDITLVCVDNGSHTDMNALIAAVNKLLPADKAIATLS